MKILNVIMCIDPHNGGGSVERICQLSKYLSLKGHSCTLLTTKKGFDINRANNLSGTNVVALPYLSERFMFPFKLVTWLYKNANKYDVIHLSMNWSIITAITFIYLKLSNKPYYFSAMGWLRIEGRARFIKHIYRILITRPLIRSAKKCIAVSNREINDYIINGAILKNIKFIPNGIESNAFIDNDNGALFRKKNNIDDRPLILFIGRIDFIKGPDLLIRAFSKVCKDFPNHQLIIAGNEIGFLSSLINESKLLNLDKKITFLGAIIGIEKLSAYKSADLFVIPSRFDSMTIVALEAAASGVPILITKECDFSELSNSSSGIEVAANEHEIEQGIRLALSDNDGLKKLAKNARKLIEEKYDWNIIVNKFIDIFSI